VVSDSSRRVPVSLSVETQALPYERLKAAILAGDLKPGQPLVETLLAQWCGVSRTPIREALLRLEQDGLVRRSDRGLTVRERSPEEILDIYEARTVLEATVGRVAAERRTDHDVRLLRASVQRGRRVVKDDLPGMVEANQQFHRMLWRACHNESLIDLLERVSLHLARFPETTLAAPGRWRTACREHEQLVDAVEGRRGQDAHDIAMAHFMAARDIRLALFAEETAGR
jgi:DNA-binding GntR family transcriptional regulator